MTGTLTAGRRESDFSIGIPDDEQQIDTDQLEIAVHTKTHRAIRNLCVTVHEGCAILTGRTHSYYNKQLATQAILEQDILVSNEIEVY